MKTTDFLNGDELQQIFSLKKKQERWGKNVFIKSTPIWTSKNYMKAPA